MNINNATDMNSKQDSSTQVAVENLTNTSNSTQIVFGIRPIGFVRQNARHIPQQQHVFSPMTRRKYAIVSSNTVYFLCRAAVPGMPCPQMSFGKLFLRGFSPMTLTSVRPLLSRLIFDLDQGSSLSLLGLRMWWVLSLVIS